jgi:hypothetical protein
MTQEEFEEEVRKAKAKFAGMTPEERKKESDRLEDEGAVGSVKSEND